MNEEFGHFVIGTDKLAAVFGQAYPNLGIRLAWDRELTTKNIAPFVGHFLGTYNSPDGRGLLPYSHGEARGNMFVLEGGYFDFETVSSILKSYGIAEMKEEFILIGLVQLKKSAVELAADFLKYDTENDWTHGFDEPGRLEIANDVLESSGQMAASFDKFGFAVYDVSYGRDSVFDRIIGDIGARG